MHFKFKYYLCHKLFENHNKDKVHAIKLNGKLMDLNTSNRFSIT